MMMKAYSSSRTARAALSPRLVRETGLVLAGVGVLLVLGVWSVATWSRIGIGFTVAAPVGFALIAMLVVRYLPAHPYPCFGLANSLTTARAGLIALIGALLFEHDTLAASPGLQWLATAGAGLALLLDGLDGWAARRWRRASFFGARFDMELDALLIALLCLLLIVIDKLGAWVALVGGLRYGFVALCAVVPRLAHTRLAPSRFRQVVCGVQGIVLTACLAPIVGPGLARPAAIIALGLLLVSFAGDTVRLWQRPAGTPR